MVNKLVKLRKDLLIKRIGVPIGNIYFFGNEKLRYRWINNDTFQVFYKSKWLEAYSIDWDFQEEYNLGTIIK